MGSRSLNILSLGQTFQLHYNITTRITPTHQHTVTNTIPMMYKRGLLIDVYRRAGQRFKNEHAVTSASAGLLVHKPKTQQQQLAPSVSGHQAARAGARASKALIISNL